MGNEPVRSAVGRWAGVLPWLLGATLLSLGLAGFPAMVMAGSILLTLAGVHQFASMHGYHVPRSGLVRATTYGCHDVPLAFYVRHHGRGLLFHRGFDSATGELADRYCVIALPRECDEQSLRYTEFEPPEDSRLIGIVPVGDLRFEHRRGAYVDAAALADALRRTSDPASSAEGEPS
jgi:hypothetical protein